MRPHRFHPAALADYQAAAVWYAERSAAAAVGFTAAIDDAIDGARELPEAWPAWPGRTDVRRRTLRRLPYSVIYVIQNDTIVIVAVAHHKRRPGYWLGRMR